MGRFVDAIHCNILEKYMSSYMRERNVDALLILRNENKWAMTGNFSFRLIILFPDVFFSFSFILCFGFGFYIVFLF
jgi:hypothetical protein